MPIELTKVTAYITCQNRLLVFRHVDHPQAGIQVPAGTPDPGEDLEAAVLREAQEESGLNNLKVEAFLGEGHYSLKGLAGDQLNIHRFFFHLSYPGPIDRESWLHWELSPSAGDDDKLLFELFWVEMPDGIPDLMGELGDMLDQISRTP